MRLHQAGVRGHHAHAEAVGAAFSRGNAALVNVIAVAIGLAISTGYPAGFVAAMAMPVASLIPESRKAAFRNEIGRAHV